MWFLYTKWNHVASVWVNYYGEPQAPPTLHPLIIRTHVYAAGKKYDKWQEFFPSKERSLNNNLTIWYLHMRRNRYCQVSSSEFCINRCTEGPGFDSRRGLGLFFVPCSRHVEFPSVCSRNNIGAWLCYSVQHVGKHVGEPSRTVQLT